MKLVTPTKLEWYCFLFYMPLISPIANLILFENRLWHDYKIWLYSVPLAYVLCIASWYSNLLYTNWAEKKFPELYQTKLRISRKVMVLFFVTTPSVLLILLLYHQFHILDYQLKTAHILQGLLTGFCINFVFETLYEVDYTLTKYKESVEEKETIQLLAVQQEFDSLKNQVNPHFLFNCFNTLSSLISIDKQKADQFLNELSKVYRYLLKSNEEGVSTLENEIKFIESYFKLLQTRHGEAVKLNIQIDNQYEQYLLPSLTLQLLIENAVKHNALSKNKPLVIDIFSTDWGTLIVRNNLQLRTVKAPSNKVGLENIKAKYELLKQPGFLVTEDGNNFTVELPLMRNQQQSKTLIQ